MGAEGSQKNLKKIKAAHKSAKALGLTKKKKNNEQKHNQKENSKLVEIEENFYKLKEENTKSYFSEKKRRNRENVNNLHDEQINHFNIEDKADGGKKKSKLLRKKKRKNDKIIEAEIGKVGKLYNEMEDGFDELNDADGTGVQKKSKSRKKKRKNEKIKKAEVEDGSDQQNDDGKMEAIKSTTQGQNESSEGQHKADIGTNFNTCKSKKSHKIKKKEHVISQKDEGLVEKRGEDEQDDVYQMSSGDEDCSRGMNKWIMQYNQSIPGLKILQQRIDDFITAHEAQEEQARKEREAHAAEGGWTVVVHHKGRKKTTDSETGIAVGSVAQAAILDNMAKKKSKEVGLDFYRFQKREAQRNEIMMLQSKFEQDKKRIQQLRAARKFRPY